MGDIQNLVDQGAKPRGDPLDSIDIVALLSDIELEVEQGFGITPHEGEGRSQLMADRGHEALAQFLQGANRRDVA